MGGPSLTVIFGSQTYTRWIIGTRQSLLAENSAFCAYYTGKLVPIPPDAQNRCSASISSCYITENGSILRYAPFFKLSDTITSHRVENTYRHQFSGHPEG